MPCICEVLGLIPSKTSPLFLKNKTKQNINKLQGKKIQKDSPNTYALSYKKNSAQDERKDCPEQVNLQTKFCFSSKPLTPLACLGKEKLAVGCQGSLDSSLLCCTHSWPRFLSLWVWVVSLPFSLPAILSFLPFAICSVIFLNYCSQIPECLSLAGIQCPRQQSVGSSSLSEMAVRLLTGQITKFRVGDAMLVTVWTGRSRNPSLCTALLWPS